MANRENMKDIGDGWFEVTLCKGAMRREVAKGPTATPLTLPLRPAKPGVAVPATTRGPR